MCLTVVSFETVVNGPRGQVDTTLHSLRGLLMIPGGCRHFWHGQNRFTCSNDVRVIQVVQRVDQKPHYSTAMADALIQHVFAIVFVP